MATQGEPSSIDILVRFILKPLNFWYMALNPTKEIFTTPLHYCAPRIHAQIYVCYLTKLY